MIAASDWAQVHRDAEFGGLADSVPRKSCIDATRAGPWSDYREIVWGDEDRGHICIEGAPVCRLLSPVHLESLLLSKNRPSVVVIRA